MYRIGLDVGSTTAKIVVLDDTQHIIYSSYRRHQANVPAAMQAFLQELASTLKEDDEFTLALTGSVGLGVAERYDFSFVQEVVAATEFTRIVHPQVSTIIDIGGEDAKIVYLKDGKVSDLRMNGNCAGGTGAFIDQMALCLGVEVTDLDQLAQRSTTLYPIASRCGVFSKTDIQNLVARNVPKTDIAASIFRAVAVQTASTLSHGCEIKPKILLCGGPLTFIPSLRKALADYFGYSLETDFVIEDKANVIPAWGTALAKNYGKIFTLKSLMDLMSGPEPERKVKGKAEHHNSTTIELPPIFTSETEYLEWKADKASCHVPVVDVSKATKQNFLGIDSGSTTTKIVLINENGEIVYKYYAHNGGNPIDAVRHGLSKLQQRAQ
ncbi:MAG: acyl-CoA dehydratase activase, partial [Bacteroidales bacterium]|nr:acyl-CoA dehydratase activase [Bacteroidales bacterium]